MTGHDHRTTTVVREEVALKVVGLGKEFDGFVAVSSVDLEVHRQEVHAVIGPNGAGKTTLFNTISRVHEADHGSVSLFGRDITRTPRHRLVGMGLGRSYQVPSLFNEVSVWENVRLAQYAARQRGWWRVTNGADDDRQISELMERFGLSDLSDRLPPSLAHGEKRKLELVMLVVQGCSVLLLDEPTAGLATEEIGLLSDLIQQLRDDGHTIILVEHNIGVVMSCADNVTVMADGSVLRTGTPAEVMADDEVKQRYLGRTGDHA